jgi:hypothetical protein
MRFVVFVFLIACGAKPADNVPTNATPTEAPASNALVEYLTGAERQGETDEQMAELRRALDDLSRLSPSELRTRKYADYVMTAGQWSVSTIIKKYMVPTHPVALDDETAIRDAQALAARAKLREHVKAIDEGRQLD